METMIDDLDTKIKKLNSQRFGILVFITIVIIAFTIVYFMIAFYLKDHYGVSSRLIRYGALPLVYFIYNYLKKKKDSFTKVYGEFIIEDVIRSCYPNWLYNQEATIDADTVNESYLVNKGSNIDMLNSISGDIGNTNFRFAELKVFKNQYLGAKLPKKLFHGYYFIFDNNKLTESRLFVRPRLLKDFGNPYFKEKKILTDTHEFDKRFLTYSDDPVKARYILTPSLMARILDFEKNFPDMISFLFYKDKLYVAIKEKKNFLEPSLFTRVSLDTINRRMDIFRLIGEIVSELNIDNKIWINSEKELGGLECV